MVFQFSNNKVRYFVLIGLILAGLPLTSSAQRVDRRVSYQGQISGAAGATTIQFRIFDDTASPVWGPEIHIVTPDSEGRFVAVVGTTEIDVAGVVGIPDLDELDAAGLELEVSIEDSGGSLVTLSPRQRLFAAFHASSAQTVVDEAITTSKLADLAVTDAKVADLTITGAKIAAETIGGDKITDGTILSGDIADAQIDGGHIIDGSVTTSEIGGNQVVSGHIVDGTITSSDIADDTIEFWDLAPSVGEVIPPNDGSIRSYIFTTGSGCPRFNGQQVYTYIRDYVITRAGGGTDTFSLCAQ